MGRNNFDKTVDDLVNCLTNMSKIQKEKGSDPLKFLEILYNHYSCRFMDDNNKIWTTANIFIPISLAGFAAIATIEQPSITQIIMLMFASLALFLIWLAIAENHRAFQQKSQAWLVAIERIIGIEDRSGPKIINDHINKIMVRKYGVQKAYWTLFFLVLIAWIIILSLTLLGLL